MTDKIYKQNQLNNLLDQKQVKCKFDYYYNNQFNLRYRTYCTNTISSSYIKYKFNNKAAVTVNGVNSIRKQFEKCLNQNNQQTFFEYYQCEHFDTNLLNNQQQQQQQTTIYILDFLPYEGPIIIDFKLIDINHQQQHNYIINLVAKQFVTFRVINIPSNVNITFLVSIKNKINLKKK